MLRRPPTVFGMDQAVRGIWHAINWQLLHGVAVEQPAAAAVATDTAAASSPPAAMAAAASAPRSAAAVSDSQPTAAAVDVRVVAAPAAAARQEPEPQAAASAAVPPPQVPLQPSPTAALQQLPGLQWGDQDALYAQLQLKHVQQLQELEHRHQQEQQQRRQQEQQLQQLQRQRQQKAEAQAYERQAYMQPPQLLVDSAPLHEEQEAHQGDDAPLGRGHRKKAPSSRINLAVQGEQVTLFTLQ